MSKKILKIAELLPEGLTEESVTAIAELVNGVIQEEVESQIKELTTKVSSFLRLQKEQLKEQALAELEQENSTYRNAQLFEEVRTLMSIELNDNDEDNAVSDVLKENTQISDDMGYLVEQFEGVLEYIEFFV